jgi:hypothetical protein
MLVSLKAIQFENPMCQSANSAIWHLPQDIETSSIESLRKCHTRGFSMLTHASQKSFPEKGNVSQTGMSDCHFAMLQ